MKEMSREMRFGKSVHDNGWGMFTDFLAYKMERAGKKLVRIDRWYPSSSHLQILDRSSSHRVPYEIFP